MSRSTSLSNNTQLVSDGNPHKLSLPEHITAAHLCGRKQLKGLLCPADRETAWTYPGMSGECLPRGE